MTPEMRQIVDELPEPLRGQIAAELDAGEAESARLKLEDLGYDDCDTCRRARLRTAFVTGECGVCPS